MPSHKPAPASIRYIKARLRFLARPAFWASCVVLLLAVLFAWEYFAHPEWLNANNDDQDTGNEQVADSGNPDDPTPSKKDIAAIGADIDSSPVLKKELEDLDSANAANSQSGGDQPEGLFDQFSREQQQTKTNGAPSLGAIAPSTSETPNYKQNVSNPFLTSAQDLLNAGILTASNRTGAKQNASAAQFLYNPTADANSLGQNQNSTPLSGAATNNPFLGTNSFNSANQNQNATAVSPLEAALRQAQSNSAASGGTGATKTPEQTLSAPAYTGQGGIQLATPPSSNATGYNLPSYANTANPPNSFTYLAPPQVVPPVPAAAPVVPPGASGTPTNYTPYQSQSPTQPTVTNPPFTTSSFGNQVAPSPQALPYIRNSAPPPFAVPNQSGQPNSGGQTNAFPNR